MTYVCHCRRCLLHDDPGGCLVAEAMAATKPGDRVRVLATDDYALSAGDTGTAHAFDERHGALVVDWDRPCGDPALVARLGDRWEVIP